MANLGVAYLQVRGDFTDLNKQLVANLSPARLGRMGKIAGASLAGGLVAAGIGKGLFDIGKKFDDTFDTIRVGTGKTGKSLEGLKDDFKSVAKTTPSDFGEIGTAVTELNERLGLTGKPLQDFAKQMLNLSRLTKTDLSTNISAVARAFEDWEVPVKGQTKALDGLFRLGQKSGASVAQLASNVQKFGSPLRILGFSLGEAAATFATFERAGVNIQTTVPGLKLAISNLTKPTADLAGTMDKLGISASSPEEGLKQVFKLLSKDSDLSNIQKRSLAMEVFGKRAGADMAEAIRQGRFEVDDMLKTFGKGDTIDKATKDTDDFNESWQRIKNNVFIGLEPVATKFFTAISDGMEALATADFDQISKDIGLKLNLGKVDFGDAGGAIDSSIESIKSIIDSKLAHLIGSDILGTLKKQVAAIGQIFRGAADVIAGTLKLIDDLIHLRFAKAFGDMAQIVKGGVNLAIGALRAFTAPVREIAARIGRALLAPLRSAWQSVKDVFSGGVSGALRSLRGMVGDAGSIAGRAGKAIASGFRSALTGIRSVANDIVGVIKRIPGRLGDVGAGILRALKSGLSGATLIPSFKVKGPGPLPDISFPAVHLPSFAKGGRVKHSLALVGEEGPELAKLPGNKITLVGRQGPEITSLPVGTRVFSHPETKRKLASVSQDIFQRLVPAAIRKPKPFIQRIDQELGTTQGRESPRGLVSVALGALTRGRSLADRQIPGLAKGGAVAPKDEKAEAAGIKTVGASQFGGPRDPATGHVGKYGDLRGTDSYAELELGKALGGLPAKHPLRITYRGREVVARKRDIGTGGGSVKGKRRAIDLWYETAKKLRFPFGTDLVKVEPFRREKKKTSEGRKQEQITGMAAGGVVGRSFHPVSKRMAQQLGIPAFAKGGVVASQQVGPRQPKWQKDFLEMARAAWPKVREYIGHGGGMPRIHFSKSGAYSYSNQPGFSRGVWIPKGDAYAAATHSGFTPTYGLGTLAHEWSHIFQAKNKTHEQWEQEGGAEAFARHVAPRAFPNYGQHITEYPSYVAHVMRDKGLGWVLNDQFEGVTRAGKAQRRRAMAPDPPEAKTSAGGLNSKGGKVKKKKEPKAKVAVDKQARSKALGFAKEVWPQTAPALHADGMPMPKVEFSGSSAMKTGSAGPGTVWVTQGKSGLDKIVGAPWFMRDLAARTYQGLHTLVHEFSHIFQLDPRNLAQQEGGAEAFAKRASPSIAAALNVPVTPTFKAYKQQIRQLKKQRGKGYDQYVSNRQFGIDSTGAETKKLKKAKKELGGELWYETDEPKPKAKAVSAKGGRPGDFASGGKEPAKGKLIGFPNQGTHTLGNWQSDNAVDVSLPVGSPLYGPGDGKVVKTGGSGSFAGRFGGYNMTLNTAGNSWFLAHLKRILARASFSRGEKIALSGMANGVPHLHLGVQHGYPKWESVVQSSGAGAGDGKGTEKKQTKFRHHGHYSLGQMVTLAKRAGFPDPALAAAIGYAESTGNTAAHNTKGEDSRGLWQINVAPEANPDYKDWDLSDAFQNVRAAYKISGGGKNWKPWSMYNNKKYRDYLGHKGAPLPKGTTKGTPTGSSYADDLAAGLIDAEGTKSDPKDDIRWINRSLRYYRGVYRRNKAKGNSQRQGEAKQKIIELQDKKDTIKDELAHPEIVTLDSGLAKIGTGPNAFNLAFMADALAQIDLEKANASLTIPPDDDDSAGALTRAYADDIPAASRLATLWEGISNLTKGVWLTPPTPPPADAPGRIALINAAIDREKAKRHTNWKEVHRLEGEREKLSKPHGGNYVIGTGAQQTEAATNLASARSELKGFQDEIGQKTTDEARTKITDRLRSLAALAALTPGKDDDVAAVQEAIKQYEIDLSVAQQGTDQGAIADAAEALKGARDDLKSLTGEIASERINFATAFVDVFKNFGSNFRALPAFAKGGVVRALVGEQGFELAKLPNQKVTLVGGQGPEIRELPIGTRIYPHGESKRRLSESIRVPAFAKGGVIQPETVQVQQGPDIERILARLEKALKDQPQTVNKYIDARHEFKEVPKDPHPWSRNIKYELEAI